MDSERRRFIQQLMALGISVSGIESLLSLTACSTLPNNRKPSTLEKNLNDSICIIGAGASGIATAHFLKTKGYQNITILEAADHIGGKCNTVQINGRDYDMGAVFTTTSYDEVKSLAQQFNVPIVPLQGRSKKNIVDVNTGVPRARSKLETADFDLAVLDYFRALEKYPNLIRSGFSELNPDLCVPLSTWMKSHSNMPASLNEFFGFTFTPFGYGYVDEVPAAYALKYYERRLVSSLMSRGNLGMVRDGYQSLWQQVAKDMNIKLSTPVLKVTRQTNGPALVETSESSAFYDHLILTCMPEDSLKFLDVTASEREDFSKTKHYFYYTVAVDVSNNFAGTGFLPENYVNSRSTHPLCWFKRWDDANVAIFYALSNVEVGVDEIIKTLQTDANHYGWNLGTVHTVKKWRYFPHFSSADLSDGIYDRMEARQGELRTYLAGEIMNFSTVELVTRYAKDLVLRFF